MAEVIIPVEGNDVQVFVDALSTLKANNTSCQELVDALAVIVNVGKTRNLAVTTPHTLEASDIGKILYFNSAANCVVNIPDTLDDGFNIMALNKGTGSVIGTQTGVKTVHGSLTLGDTNGLMSIIMIDDIIQTSERDSEAVIVVPVMDWILHLTANTDKILFAEILITTGQSISAYFRNADTASARTLWSGTTNSLSYAYILNGVVTCANSATIKVDDVATTAFPSDGALHKVEITFNQDVYIDRLCVNHSGIFPFYGDIDDVTFPSGEFFEVDDNAQTIVGSLGTVMTLTGGTWEEYEVV